VVAAAVSGGKFQAALTVAWAVHSHHAMAIQGEELPPKIVESIASAREAGLRYVSDLSPGIRRAREGEGFAYFRPDGTPVTDDKTLHRIRALAIPPAWTEVWICPDPRGHIQATGRDARRRKQYRYHAEWREARDQDKYGRMAAFARALPKIRRRVARDTERQGLPREKVLATVVRLLETTMIRVGNEEYARENHSFGLTTMRSRHVRVKPSGTVRFFFRGKSGREHEVEISDRRIAKIIRQCQDLPGQELFQYVDDGGERRHVDSDDVNQYLREISGQDFTAKDFRTWAGTLLAARALQEFEQFDTRAQAKKNVVLAIEAVARLLGNTRAVCRKCYVHPAILDAYLDGTMLDIFRRRAEEKMQSSLRALRAEEAAVLALLQQRLKREQRQVRAARRQAA
jgi:DNA topoisomerase I